MADFTDGRFYAVGGNLRKAAFHMKTDGGETNISMGFEVATLSKWVDEDFCAEIAACLNAHDELVAALREALGAVSYAYRGTDSGADDEALYAKTMTAINAVLAKLSA